MRSIVFGALVGCAAALNAQVPTSGALLAAEGQIGRTVRITTGAERRLTGSLQRIQGETLFVRSAGTALANATAIPSRSDTHSFQLHRLPSLRLEPAMEIAMPLNSRDAPRQPLSSALSMLSADLRPLQ